jgi:hypothetical protein
MRRARSFVVSAVVLASASFAGGCAEQTTLTGSIGTSHDLTFDDVTLRRLTDQQAFELKYLRALDGGGDDIVAKIVFDAPAGGVVLDEAIDLVEQNGVVERITARNDPFPPLQTGTLTFTAGGVDDGDDTRGRFNTTFDNGRTLNGTFAVPLAFASFDDAAP